MKDLSIFRRGQVWFISDNVMSKGSIQCKSRPYLIVSNDICNTYSPVIHAAPITSQFKKDQPTHVSYTADNITNTILLEQIMPKSIPHISKTAKYMYTLSEHIMKKVEEAIIVQFNLSKVEYSEEDVEETMPASMSETIAEIAVTKDTSQLDKEEDGRKSQIEKFNIRMEKYESIKNDKKTEEVSDVEISRSKTGRIRWTPEVIHQFLRDAEKMSEANMLVKYELKKSTYRTTLSKLRKSYSEKRD